MIFTKAPFRLSFFGGSSDYEDFYKLHGSFIIGTTIDKYVYSFIRFRPKIVSRKSFIDYSKREEVEDTDEIQHPLVREIFKLYNIKEPLHLHTFSDIPQRTGLGGSSSFSISIIYAIKKLFKLDINKKSIATDAINIERYILKESGGIQDQILASYGGLNTIEINTNGDFFVRPVPVSEEFKNEFENSLVLIYTEQQRSCDSIAKSHENKDKTNILNIAKEAYNCFVKEDIKEIGKLLKQSWVEKKKISNLISTPDCEHIESTLENLPGVFGYKMLGAGGGGFVLTICDSCAKNKLIETYKTSILPIKFDNFGVHCFYQTLLPSDRN